MRRLLQVIEDAVADYGPAVAWVLAVALVILAGVTAAGAQTGPCGPPSTSPVANPTTLCVEPSIDHGRVIDGGEAAVTEYALEIYLVGAAAPIWSVSLGKPTPANGAIRVPLPTIPAIEWFTPYEGKVVAIGPTGSGRSEVSNRFFFGTPRAPGRPVIGL